MRDTQRHSRIDRDHERDERRIDDGRIDDGARHMQHDRELTAHESDIAHARTWSSSAAASPACGRRARWPRADVRITLIDRRNHHLFQPLLYQVATAGLSAPDIAAPLRHILRKQRNVEVRLGEVRRHRRRRRARSRSPTATRSAYDYLLLATGATHAYFGHDDWARARAGPEDARRRAARSGAACCSRSSAPKPRRSGRARGLAAASPSSAAARPASSWPARWPRSRATRCAASSATSIRRTRACA